MRLITHNMLMCNKKGVTNGFPLRIEPEELEVVACAFEPQFVRKMLHKIDWRAFVAGAASLRVSDAFPESAPTPEDTDEALLRAVHHALLEVHVKKGKLVCPESGREFPIIDGIPNMLLREDEV